MEQLIPKNKNKKLIIMEQLSYMSVEPSSTYWLA